MKRRRRSRFSLTRLATDDGYGLERLSAMTFEIMEVGRRALQVMPPRGNGPACLGQLVVQIWRASVHAAIQLEKLNRDEYEQAGE